MLTMYCQLSHNTHIYKVYVLVYGVQHNVYTVN